MTNEIKNMPELRFSGFSEEWKKKKLEEIAYINDGTHMTPNYVQAGIPFFSVENVTRNDFVNSKFVTEEAYEKYKKRIDIEYNDILMTRIGSIGKVKLVNWIHSTTFYVSLALLKIHEGFVPQYISYLLESFKVQKSIMSNSLVTAVPQKINLIDLKKVDIVLTISINEQQRIGDFFSKLDRQIELEEQKLEKLEEQKKGYMQKIFSQELRFKDENDKDYPAWEIKKLGDLYKYQQGQQIPVENQYKIQINNMKRFIRIVDVTENPKKRYIKDRKESGLINQKDLIMIRYGASAGTISMGYEGVIANNLFKFVKKQNVDNRYFYFLLKKSHFKIKSLSSQSAMPALNFNAMDTLKFSIPQYSEQQKIGGFFSELDKLVEKQNQKIDGLKERKKGFLQKMFV